ncbi:putative transcriptional regulator [Parageobacillus toebii NBRC 107807]|uniref:Transcriptional regulator n=1 Tax=Parageobacillus toebii NBRC 107807 TaxID=1223503 RepID=A0AA89P214_9BACL|nr:putative transcriptional regulator [Parageobacillus toebii NBRC 107807]
MEMIQNIANEYKELYCVPVVYWDEDEIIDLIRPFIHQVDMWLFSGQVPYSIVKEWGEVDCPMFYVPHTGASLYRTLLHIYYERQIPIHQLSFDTYHPSEIERLLDEAGICERVPHVKHYQGEISAEVLAQYHYELWKQGVTKAAVTCLRTAHLELQKLGVPVYRVLPARSAVESVMQMIIRTGEMLRFQDAQIAVQMIEVDSLSAISSETFSTDEIYKMEMKVTEKLLRYAKKIQGSLKTAGPGRYVIFTTRGVLKDITDHYRIIPAMDEIEHIDHEMVTCGIGIGRTAYEAEIHAGKAFLHAKKYGRGTWMVVFDDDTIVGPLGRSEQIRYSFDCAELQAISQKTNLSVATLSKLSAILRKLGKNEINAYELATNMQILPRSARRILNELKHKGLAEVIGETNPYPRGRPRKIYRIFYDY